jgi:RNA polymerase sigma-70 factor (ECF subfamily)
VAPPETATDDGLLARVARGDGTALAALYDRWAPGVLGLLLQILGDRGEAEEVLQEVFLQVWQSADRYRPELARPGTWLLLMARSRALDRRRSTTARRRREFETHRQGPRRCSAPLGTARLEKRESWRQVCSALERLPPEQREAIELAFFEGLTHSEISRRLAVPLGTAKSRLLIGVRKLRQMLGAPPAPAAAGRGRVSR